MWSSLLLALALSADAAAPQPPRKVLVGAFLNDVQFLELKSHSYAVDLYLWFRWKDPRIDPSESAEFMNPFELWGHARNTAYPKPIRLPSGERYQVLRVQGRFSRKLPLGDYPFDRQLLTVDVEDAVLEASELIFESGGVDVNPELQLPGYKIGPAEMTSVVWHYPTAFGDPRRPLGASHSRLRLAVPIERPALTYSVKLLLPILCVVFCAALMFLFHPKHVDARVGIGITSLLTIVALQITLNDELPEVDYLVLMDKVYLGAYLFVIAGLATVVQTTWRMEEGQAAKAAKLERKLLGGFLAAYLAAMTALILPRI